MGRTTTSFLSARDAGIAGMGLTLLPCYLGDCASELERLGPLLPELATDPWLLVHDDLRHTARIRVFGDFLWKELKKLQSSIEGRRPS
jgi:DNA-binding transcriptional LysR family regulator